MTTRVLALIALMFLSCSRNKKAGIAIPEDAKNRIHNLQTNISKNYPDNEFVKRSEVFLFANLIYHTSINHLKSDSYLSALKAHYSDETSLLNQIKSLKAETFQRSDTIYDANVIDSTYFIRNIRSVVSTYQKSAWRDQISFENFCNYIFTYRINHDPL